MNPARATAAQLAATRALRGVTAAAGPFAEATVQVQFHGQPWGQLTLAGRASPGGPVDDAVLTAGHWPDAPGQVVLDGTRRSSGGLQVGNTLTVTGLPGSPVADRRRLRQLVTDTADGWVAPGEVPRLQAPGSAGERAAAVPVHQRGHRRPRSAPTWRRSQGHCRRAR